MEVDPLRPADVGLMEVVQRAAGGAQHQLRGELADRHAVIAEGESGMPEGVERAAPSHATVTITRA